MKSKKLQKGAARRRKLFELYSANYAIHDPDIVREYGAMFRCPICARRFSALALDNDLLDIAHVYPQACGGKLATLTCRDCNNRIGRMYDHELKRELNLWNALGDRSDGTINGHVEIDGLRMGVEVSRRGG